MAIPSVLKAYACFVDGRGYAGKADVTPPELAVVTEEYAAGGMSGKVKLDMGLLEAIDGKFTLYEYDPNVLKLWGLANGSSCLLVFRGGIADDAGAVKKVKITMRGQLQMVSMGSWEAGAKTSIECTVNCRSYQLEIDGEMIYDINLELMTRIVGGVDQMAALRGAIGV